MSTAVTDSTSPATRLRWLVSDSLVMAGRNIQHIRQIPEKLLDVTLQPIMFVLLFAFVFGGVIAIPGGDYREYLLAGVLIQSLTFGCMGPAASIATDLREGVIDRFRSLPTARASYIIGHIIAEQAASLLAISVLSLTGLMIGWRIHTDFGSALAAYGVIVLFSFAMLWVGTLLGLIVRSPDAAQGIVFMVVFPGTFLASTFVPIAGLSPVLADIAAWNPVSAQSAAIRTLFGNPTAMPPDAPWPLQHPVVAAVGFSLVLIAVCMPLALRQFRVRTTG